MIPRPSVLLRLAIISLMAIIGATSASAATSFTEPGYGYSLSYPDGWRLEKPQAYTLILRPPVGEGGEAVSVSLQNRKAPETPPAGKPAKGKPPTATPVEQMAKRYVTEIGKNAQGLKVHREAPFRWESEAAVLGGRQVVVDFTLDGLPLRQWAVFLPNPKAPVIHVWIMTAPQNDFDRWLAPARTSLDTLRAVSP